MLGATQRPEDLVRVFELDDVAKPLAWVIRGKASVMGGWHSWQAPLAQSRSLPHVSIWMTFAQATA